MRKINKLRSTMLAIFLTFLLIMCTACGNESENSVPESDDTTEQQTTSQIEVPEENSEAETTQEIEEVSVEDEDSNLSIDSVIINEPGRYTLFKVNGDVDWDAIPELTLDNIQWEPDQGVRAFGQLCYDEETLYVHLRAVESDIRAEYTEPMSPVYQDSCLEFFFMPETEDQYFNFEINPNGCLYVGFGHGISDSAPQDLSDIQTLFNIRSGRTDDGWEVYYDIPLSFLQEYYSNYSFSGSLKANIYKCGDKTSHKHYLTWNYVNTEKPNFHHPDDFGTMIFGD